MRGRFTIARGILGDFHKRQYDSVCCLLAVSRVQGTISLDPSDGA